MESSCVLCSRVSMLLYKSTGNGWHPDESFFGYNRVLIGSQFRRRIWASASTERRNSDKRRKDKVGIVPKKKLGQLRQLGQQRSLLTVYQNGDPLGRKDLGKGVIKWICQGMKSMVLSSGKVV